MEEMPKLSTLIRVFKELLKVNLYKTLFFNFKKLPLNKACRLPFLFYGKVNFKDISGEINILQKALRFGMIRFGGSHEVVTSSINPTFLLIKGSVNFEGSAKFGKGVKIVVWKNGGILLGDQFSLGSESHIVSFRGITFGKNCLISWNCNFFDTDFHFIKNLKTLEVQDNCSPVVMGNNIWFGSHVTALKGTVLPDNIIVGSKSLLSGDYTKKAKQNSIIGGNPAKLLKEDYSYVCNRKEERIYFNEYINK